MAKTEEIRVRKPEPVVVSSSGELGGTYTAYGLVWSTKDLWKMSEDLKPFEMPIEGLSLSYMPWRMNTIQEFIHHMKRVDRVDMNYPIILDVNGVVADGHHRIAKAILEVKPTILAKRLKVMPDPIEEEKR